MASYMKSDHNGNSKDLVLRKLNELFGSVLSLDIIKSVALSTNYDVEKSTNSLIEISSNIDDSPKKNKPRGRKTIARVQKNIAPQSTVSKLQPSSSSNAISKKSKKQTEIDRVISLSRGGYKVLIILRGLPGSGKTHLAKQLVDNSVCPAHYAHHILSTDDYFVQNGIYNFDSRRLEEAHGWNHRRTFEAMCRGFSPIIIDNTNTQMWEMKPYAMMATDYGYYVEILEPDTWWSSNDKELAKRNIHGVPRNKIKDMLDRYEKSITAYKLFCAYTLMYKFQKPPQYRLMPPLNNSFDLIKAKSVSSLINNYSELSSGLNRNDLIDTSEVIDLIEFKNDVSLCGPQSAQNHQVNLLDEILTCPQDNVSNILQPKIENNNNNNNMKMDKLLDSLENAWGIDEKAMQSWDIVTPICAENRINATSINEEERALETTECGTNTERIDFDLVKTDGFLLPDGVKIIYSQSRDINVGLLPKPSRVPKKITVDQSCLTDEEEVIQTTTGNDIQKLADLFPGIPKSYLTDIYDKCKGNFHWALDILIDGPVDLPEEDGNGDEVNNDDEEDDNDDDDDEEEEGKSDGNSDTANLIDNEYRAIEENSSDDSVKDKGKFSKRKAQSYEAIELKKCIEGKIDIGKEHYSNHVLKVKQYKFGTNNEPQSSTSHVVDSNASDSDSDDDKTDEECNPKNMIEFNLGEQFVAQLETKFGDPSMGYPKGFQAVVQMPVDIAQKLYELYLESVYQQMETQNEILQRLVKEDEEFAKKLQAQEQRNIDSHVVEETPNLLEVMNEQAAMNFYKKETEHWKNMTADTLAARLTRRKLFDVFPNIDKNVLTEILHAYGNNYTKTLEVLVASAGEDNIQVAQGIISEPPLSESAITEMKEAESSCVLDFEDSEESFSATHYREEATKYLKKREELYQKAQCYYQKGMTEVAQFYSELAKKQTQLYDRANNMAAMTFLDENSKRLQRPDTLDLHFLYVKEAISALDLFIDRKISQLKTANKTSHALKIITGWGKNSEGGVSRIKPAVIARLKKRKISYTPVNPGSLRIKVLISSMLSNNLS